MDDNDYKVFETTKLIIMIRMSMTKQNQTDYVIDIFDEGTIYWFMFDWRKDEFYRYNTTRLFRMENIPLLKTELFLY